VKSIVQGIASKSPISRKYPDYSIPEKDIIKLVEKADKEQALMIMAAEDLSFSPSSEVKA